MSPRAVKEWIGKTSDTPVPSRVKLRVWERENGTCYLSGRKIQPCEPYQFEHKIAIINGGENRESNLFLALVDKHKIKTKADLAEKSTVAEKAKKHVGITRPAAKIKSPGFAKGAKPKRETRAPAHGSSEISRRFRSE
jgi:hypothetical protein